MVIIIVTPQSHSKFISLNIFTSVSYISGRFQIIDEILPFECFVASCPHADLFRPQPLLVEHAYRFDPRTLVSNSFPHRLELCDQ